MNEKMRKALGFLGLIEDEYGDYASNVPSRPFSEPVGYEDEGEWAPAPPRPTPPPPRQSGARPSSISVLDAQGQVARPRPMPSSRTRPVPPTPQREPVVFFPPSFHEAGQTTDLLRSGRVVVLNITQLEPAVGRRLVDFTSGTAWAMRAKVERLGTGVYLVSPQGTHLSAEARENLRLSGFRSFDLS